MAKLSRGLAAGAIGLVLAGQAGATVVRDPKQTNISSPAVEEGGHRLSGKERKQVACTQIASPIMGVNSMAPWGFWPGMLSPRFGRMLTDGGMACIVKPDR
jgi:hypothetical protein